MPPQSDGGVQTEVSAQLDVNEDRPRGRKRTRTQVNFILPEFPGGDIDVEMPFEAASCCASFEFGRQPKRDCKIPHTSVSNYKEHLRR